MTCSAQKSTPTHQAAPDWVAAYYSPEPDNSPEPAFCSEQDALSQMFAYYEG